MEPTKLSPSKNSSKSSSSAQRLIVTTNDKVKIENSTLTTNRITIPSNPKIIDHNNNYIVNNKENKVIENDYPDQHNPFTDLDEFSDDDDEQDSFQDENNNKNNTANKSLTNNNKNIENDKNKNTNSSQNDETNEYENFNNIINNYQLKPAQLEYDNLNNQKNNIIIDEKEEENDLYANANEIANNLKSPFASSNNNSPKLEIVLNYDNLQNFNDFNQNNPILYENIKFVIKKEIEFNIEEKWVLFHIHIYKKKSSFYFYLSF
jgi:hypothetical protein